MDCYNLKKRKVADKRVFSDGALKEKNRASGTKMSFNKREKSHGQRDRVSVKTKSFTFPKYQVRYNNMTTRRSSGVCKSVERV